MGQQQIFLLIVVFIVVTIAVIVALNMSGEIQVEFKEDEYSQIMMETGELFRATYEKPELFGGGNHDWNKVNFKNVPCSFGESATPNGNVCRSNGGELIVIIKSFADHLNLHAVAHIGGGDVTNIYTREMNVFRDSLVFHTDWIAHQ